MKLHKKQAVICCLMMLSAALTGCGDASSETNPNEASVAETTTATEAAAEPTVTQTAPQPPEGDYALLSEITLGSLKEDETVWGTVVCSMRYLAQGDIESIGTSEDTAYYPIFILETQTYLIYATDDPDEQAILRENSLEWESIREEYHNAEGDEEKMTSLHYPYAQLTITGIAKPMPKVIADTLVFQFGENYADEIESAYLVVKADAD